LKKSEEAETLRPDLAIVRINPFLGKVVFHRSYSLQNAENPEALVVPNTNVHSMRL
jgi:hypothetical protein